MYLARYYILFLLIFLLFTPPLLAAKNSNVEKVVIPLNNWTSQRVLSKVVGTLIQQLGEKLNIKISVLKINGERFEKVWFIYK